jgi:hypothetical protein
MFNHKFCLRRKTERFFLFVSSSKYLKKFVIVDHPDTIGPVEGNTLDRNGRVDLRDGAHLGRVPAREIPTQNVGRMLNKIASVAKQLVQLEERATYTRIL